VARLARVIAVDVPHHVTQRGNARRYVLDSDTDRAVYLDLLRQYTQLHHLSLIGYCLMSNHVHLVVIPHTKDSLSVALKQTHGRYAAYWNARHTSSGHAWQGRFYSCPLDEPHLWAALRYAELNSVRAGVVAQPEAWPWSSAAAHCGLVEPDVCLEMEVWRKRWDFASWREYLGIGETKAELSAIRACTHTGRPLGSAEFVKALEQATVRRLAPQKGGRKVKRAADDRQEILSFRE
jgi:putative transposase